MISENTTLILGAGASKPYGYPTAVELREEIITNFLPLYKHFITDGLRNPDIDNLPYIKNVKQLIDAFKNSSTSSIDLFLSRNQSFYKIGKEVISFILANYEMKSRFREEITERRYDWYFALYNILTKDIVKSDDITNFNENKISIITFNYDRSFEHFFYESLWNSFLGKRKEIDNIIRKFKIIHVYGKLASLPWEDNGGVGYKANHLLQSADQFPNNINIIFDERESVQEEIKTLITESKHIFFLGFGYAKENIEALGLDTPILKKGQRIYGTALDLTESEIIRNISAIRTQNSQVEYESFYFENCDSLTLLRNYLRY